MGNALYDAGREAYLGGTDDWNTNDHRVILLDEADYTPNLSTDDFLNDIAGAARVATSGALQSPTITAGVADADDIVLASVSGDPSESLTIYRHTGTESTSVLNANIDTATGLPITPNGGPVNIVWAATSNKIFKL